MDLASAGVGVGTDQFCPDGQSVTGIDADGFIVCSGDSPGSGSGGTFVQVSAGAGYSCGVTTDQTVLCWGRNADGESTPPPHDPGTFQQVSAGGWPAAHSCGVTTDQTVVCWGDNSLGQSSPPIF